MMPALLAGLSDCEHYKRPTVWAFPDVSYMSKDMPFALARMDYSPNMRLAIKTE